METNSKKQGAGSWEQGGLRFLAFCILQLAFCILHSLPHQVDAADLQWRRGRAPEADAAKAESSTQRDSGVRAAGWEDPSMPVGGGPVLSSGTGEATLRSVVVNRAGESGSMRAAQREPPGQSSTGAGAGQTPTQSNSSLEEMLRSFGQPSTQQGTQPTAQPGAQPPAGARPFEPDTFQLPPETSITPPGGRGQPAPGTRIPEEVVATEKERADAVCSQELADIKLNTLDKVVLDINIRGASGRDFPFECAVGAGEWHAGRCWPETTFMWKASALCHKPLYFEDEQMERYGHSWGPCCDPIVSGVHFFTRLPVLPYCMGVTPPCECVYALGHYRPGSCAPRYIEPVPISWRGALFQAGAVVGTAAILP